MITTTDLDHLLNMMRQHGLQKLHVREGGELLALTLETSGEPAAARSDMAVHAKGLGRFLSRHPRLSKPIAAPGDQVTADTIIGFLENGSVLMPVVAGHAGQLVRINVEDGSLVGFGTSVAIISTEG